MKLQQVRKNWEAVEEEKYGADFDARLSNANLDGTDAD